MRQSRRSPVLHVATALAIYLAITSYNQLSITGTLGADSGMGGKSPEEEQPASDASFVVPTAPAQLCDSKCSNF